MLFRRSSGLVKTQPINGLGQLAIGAYLCRSSSISTGHVPITEAARLYSASSLPTLVAGRLAMLTSDNTVRSTMTEIPRFPYIIQ